MKKKYILLARLTVCLTGMLTSALLTAQTSLISLGDGGFETGSTFAAHGWSVTSASQPNQWVVGGNAFPGFSGTQSAYISDSYATVLSNHYDFNNSSIVHLYRDVVFPAGEPNVMLSFNYNMKGDNTKTGGFFNNDFLSVYVSQSGSPAALVGGVSAPAGASNYTLIATVLASNGWNGVDLQLPSSVIGNTSVSRPAGLYFNGIIPVLGMTFNHRQQLMIFL